MEQNKGYITGAKLGDTEGPTGARLDKDEVPHHRVRNAVALHAHARSVVPEIALRCAQGDPI